MSDKEYEAMKKKRNEQDKKTSIIVFSTMVLSLIAGLTYIVIYS